MSPRIRWIALALGLGSVAGAAPDEGRLRDIGYVFHPARVAIDFGDLGERVLLFSQAVAVLMIIGGLLARLRKAGAQLEHIATMVLLVGFISTLPVWRTLVVELGDSAADALGNRAVRVASLEATPPDAPVELTPFMLEVGELIEQWTLGSSPTSDALDGGWRPGEGREEQWLGKGWNWAKPPLFNATTGSEQAWSAATAAERAGLLHRVVLGVGFLLQVTETGFYLAETLRWVLFHAGFALAPLMIAGLGTDSFRGASLRGLIGVAGVSFWSSGWSLVNVASSAMMRAAIDILGKTAHAALYPEVTAGAARTIAQAAPHLSWTITTEMAAITVALCAWMLLSLASVPLLVHGMASAGARWAGWVGTGD